MLYEIHHFDSSKLLKIINGNEPNKWPRLVGKVWPHWEEFSLVEIFQIFHSSFLFYIQAIKIIQSSWETEWFILNFAICKKISYQTLRLKLILGKIQKSNKSLNANSWLLTASSMWGSSKPLLFFYLRERKFCRDLQIKLVHSKILALSL